jgi:hypothetical protein
VAASSSPPIAAAALEQVLPAPTPLRRCFLRSWLQKLILPFPSRSSLATASLGFLEKSRPPPFLPSCFLFSKRQGGWPRSVPWEDGEHGGHPRGPQVPAVRVLPLPLLLLSCLASSMCLSFRLSDANGNKLGGGRRRESPSSPSHLRFTATVAA